MNNRSIEDRNMIKIKTFLLSLLLLSQTLLYQVSLPQLVLCIGEDGHVAIEGATEEATCLAHPLSFSGVAPNATLYQAYHEQADDCVDIFLDWHMGIAQYKHESKLVKTMPLALRNQIIPHEYTNRTNIINNDDEQSAIHISGTQIARSIILLI